MKFRLSWLPVVEDVDESPYVYGYLCDLIEANHPIILGPNNSNIPRIIAIFAEAFSVEALPASNEVHKRMVNITRQVQVCYIIEHLLIYQAGKTPFNYLIPVKVIQKILIIIGKRTSI